MSTAKPIINARPPYAAKYRMGPALGGVTGLFEAEISIYAKPNADQQIASPYLLGNDWIASKIAEKIGLPTPPSAIVEIDTPQHGVRNYFATLNFGQHFQVFDPDLCVKTDLMICTGILLFDILIANPDRHSANLSFAWHAKPAAVLLFDHGHALLGHVAQNGPKRLSDLKDRLGCSGGMVTQQNRHIFLDKINSDKYFDYWLDRIEKLPNYQIEDACFCPYDIGLNQQERAMVCDFIKHRRDTIRRLVANEQREFRGITQFSIPNSTQLNGVIHNPTGGIIQP